MSKKEMSPEEARRIIADLKDIKKISRQQRIRLQYARQLSRREFLKEAVAASIGLGFGLGILHIDKLTLIETAESVLESYEQAFKAVTDGHSRGEDLYEMYMARKRVAEIRGHKVTGLGKINLNDEFWVGVDMQQVSRTRVGVASYTAEHNLLILYPLVIDDVFKGALMAHEVQHVYDDLFTKLDFKNSTDDFFQSEVNAYNLEIDLLNHLTQGEFNTIVNDFVGVAELGETYMPKSVPISVFQSLDSQFVQTNNPAESQLRQHIYEMAIVFASIQMYAPDESIDKKKAEFVEFVFSHK